MPAPDLSSDGLAAYKQQALHDWNTKTQSLHQRASGLHARYVEPAVDSLSARARRHPVRAAFLGSFTVFAFLPVLAFAAFALGTLLVVGGTALVVTTFIISWILATAGLVLLVTLGFAAFFSILATLSLGATYAVYRFWVLLKESDTLPAAIQDFRDEAAALLLPGSFDGSEGSARVRFDGTVKKEDGEGAGLNDVKEKEGGPA